MTHEQIRNEMTRELTIWFAVNELDAMSVDEAIIEYDDVLNDYQRDYLLSFWKRWDNFDA